MIRLTYEDGQLIFKREDGSIVIKQLKDEPDLFKRTLLEYLAEMDERGGGGGGPSTDVYDWAKIGNQDTIPASKIPAVSTPSGETIVEKDEEKGTVEIGTETSGLNLKTNETGVITVNDDSRVSLMEPWTDEE